MECVTSIVGRKALRDGAAMSIASTPASGPQAAVAKAALICATVAVCSSSATRSITETVIMGTR